MEFKTHTRKGKVIAELISEGQVINELQDGVDLLGNASYIYAQSIIVYKSQLHPDFFDLRTGLAGEILQKFSNYRMKLAVIGDFDTISSKSLRDFILESNKLGQINFVGSLDEALSLFS